MSTGLLWLHCGGRISSKAFIVSADSSASSPPPATRASVASTPGPPALVTNASRLPRGRGCLASTSDMKKMSAMLLTRSTPERRKAASSTSSLPVSAPVCEAAALAAAAVRPALMTMTGLLSETSRAADRNEPRVADRFHVDDDAVGARIVAEVVDQVAPVHVEHRADGDEGAEADVLAQAPVQHRRAQGSALAEEGDVARPRNAVRKGRVKPLTGIHHAQAVGADHAHLAANDLGDLPLQLLAVLAVLLEAGGDDDGPRNAKLHRLANHVGNGVGRRADDHQVHLVGKSRTLGYALMPSTFGRLELTGKTVPPKGLLSRFHSTERPTLPGRSEAPITATLWGRNRDPADYFRSDKRRKTDRP